MLELLLACAPAVDPVTMAAIVKQESGGSPWVIYDNTGKRSYRLSSKVEAVLKATELISAGSSVDLGLAQINSKNLRWLGLSVEQVMDPCTNVSAGAKILEGNYKRTGDLNSALSMYNTGRADSSVGRAYTEKVFRHAGVVVPAIPGGRLPELPELPDAPGAPLSSGGKVRADRVVPVSPSAPAGFTPRWF